jgi:hypothetical protein
VVADQVATFLATTRRSLAGTSTELRIVLEGTLVISYTSKLTKAERYLGKSS